MRPDHDRQFYDYLGARGLKLTRQRRLILTAFLAHGHGLSADEFFRELRAQGHAIGYVTVYRTLKLLAGSGLARDIRADGGPTRYGSVAEETN
ncbi:Fur family transcriptional regulator [Geobacter sp. FeAm09]|uniref:Fur family transcriptional regulator n=1 Tax=Geobacter sp. FeAm09 TaxID=2597769 RepID=UPI00143D81D8|nr:transcriptional repressor [Geobacter sp. FeAm09]